MADDWKTHLASSDLDDPNIWSQRLPSSTGSAAGSLLETLDRELRCQICQELFRAPVTLPCQHTFCSECIRKALARQYTSQIRSTRCVSCNFVVDHRNDKCYVPNWSLEKAVAAFAKLRGPLLQVLETVASSIKTTQAVTNDDDEEDGSDADSCGDDQVGRSDQENKNNRAVDPSNLVRPRKAKQFYGRKTKAQLREMCRSEGLPEHGNEDELRNRHQAFVTLYNSECDALHPLPIKDIVSIIINRENERNRQKYAPTFKDIQSSKPLKQQMNDGFRQLIAKAKKNQARKRDETTANQEPTPLGEEKAMTNSELNAKDDDVTFSAEGILVEAVSSPGTRNAELIPPAAANGISPRRSQQIRSAEDQALPSPPAKNRTRSSFFPIPPKLKIRETKIDSMLLRMSKPDVQECGSLAESADEEPSEMARKKQKRDIAPASPQGASSSPPSSASSSSSTNNKQPPSRSHSVIANNNKIKPRKRRSSISSARRSGPPSIIGPWTCRLCTFRNQTNIGSQDKCAMCATARTPEIVSLLLSP